MGNIAMLGTGLIGSFYTTTLHSLRSPDRVSVVYSRSIERGAKFQADFGVPKATTDMKAAIADPDVSTVVIGLPNDMHKQAVALCAKHRKNVLCTKPLGRTRQEAKAMLDLVEQAGIFGGYLEDLCYTPKMLKSLTFVRNGGVGRVLWVRSRETHGGPHSSWFWDPKKAGGGAIIDLGCHCVEIARNYIGKQDKPLEVMCWLDTQVHPIPAEDHAIALVKYASGAIGQFEVSWCFRGGMDLRDEVMGTEGTIWSNNYLRTGLEWFSTGKGGDYVAEKLETSSGWLFPSDDDTVALGYKHMFTDMLDGIDQQRAPQETFYDGYIVNCILDACYQSAKARRWVPVEIEDWRGPKKASKRAGSAGKESEQVMKRELLPDGRVKLIIKDKRGKVVERIEKA